VINHVESSASLDADNPNQRSVPRIRTYRPSVFPSFPLLQE